MRRSGSGPLPVEATTYVGRRQEIAEVKRLLGTGPMVTLTGPGGVGKTRLAVRVADAARASFAERVVFVGLADLREEKLLPSTVAERMGVGDRSTRTPVDRIVEQFRDQRVLLLLDNCEHLVEACAALVGVLLAECPHLVVLATSRQSLGVAAERVVPVSPLAVPEPDEPPAALADYDAVQLFAERATAVVPSFAIDGENAGDVVRLCTALDGLPLAIELAAVRLRSLSVRQLADRLDKRFTLLNKGNRDAPSRHETLRALIDWSYELCDERERLLWARASVFSGSFDLDAAEHVCSGGALDRAAVLDLLDALLDKSILLREEHDGIARYRMLETVRQYGEDRLAAAGDLHGRRGRHRDWYRDLSARFARESFGPDQVAWMTLLAAEHANLRGALDYCTTDAAEAAVGLGMFSDINEHWLLSGHNTEGRLWASALLDTADPGAPERARALVYVGFLALIQGDATAYESALDDAVKLADATGDAGALAYALHIRGYEALMGDESAKAAALFGDAATRFAALGDELGELWATFNSGLAIARTGDLDRGREVLRGAIARYTARGEVFWRSWALWSLSAAEYLLGDMEVARQACLDVLRIQKTVDDRVIIAFTLTVLAGCDTHQNRPTSAARLLGAASTLWQALGATISKYVAFIEPMQRDIAIVTTEIGPQSAAEHFMAGATMTFDETLAYALNETKPPTTPPGSAPTHTPTSANPLTPRETQIAELVAQGLTNKEIATQLVIAPRTADTHVEHIRTKLAFSNRAQIAAWVAETKPRKG
ncbi:LuxR C-terminal-related transcriptional regulator [Actinokineospora guangxiensis]|uniref:LuxR C-terminal-related transcriptional regulator n=1 Tax=Actinokineospora guangxiensis TaxID=1490288 RepID=A0ABW0ERQ2_9PSEU